MVDSQHFKVKIQGWNARFVFEHLDIRRFVCSRDGSQALVLHRLEWVDQPVAVGSFQACQWYEH